MSDTLTSFAVVIPVTIGDTPEHRELMRKLLHGADEEKKMAEEAIIAVATDPFIKQIKKGAIKAGL